jgi:guanylate kinase
MQLLYTLTAFVQREIRWAIILRYTKRFAIFFFSSEQVPDCMLNGQDVLLQLDVQGAATVHKLLSQDAVFIFMVTESEMALVKWLVERKTEF